MQFNQFNPAEATNMNSIAIFGKRATGKTTLVQELLYQLRCPYTIAISPIDQEYAWMSSCSNEFNIFNEYTENHVDELVKRQCDKVNNSNIRKTEVVPACIVFDGCLLQTDNFKHNGIRTLYLNGTCMKVKIIMAMQYAMQLPNCIKGNIDYIFIFREQNLSNLRRLYTMYANIFPTFKLFCDTLETITKEPYTCMVIDRTKHSNDLTKNVFWYKADAPWRNMVYCKKQQSDVIREELMQKTWHPSRLQCCLSIDEVGDIFHGNLD